MENNIITIVPSYRCNMNCTFCYNNSIKNVKENNVIFPQLYYNKVHKKILEMKNSGETEIILKLYGGEILADFWNGDYYTNLFIFLIEVNNLCIENKLKLKVQIITNLFHYETGKWLIMFSGLKKRGVEIELQVSFDIVGRFDNIQIFNIFKQNLEVYKNYIKDIMITMTKPTVDVLLHKREPNELETEEIKVLDDLYSKYCINFTDYVASNDSYKFLVCSNEDRLEFYKFLYKKYPKSNVLESLIMIANGDDISGKSCYEKYGLDPKANWINTCTYSSIGNKYVKETDKKKLIQNMNNKLGCLTCEFYNKCPSTCPMSSATMLKTGECYLKEMIKYIKEDK